MISGKKKKKKKAIKVPYIILVQYAPYNYQPSTSNPT